MYVRVWQYDVADASREEFERVYRSDGDWAQLFDRGPGYVGTELFRSAERAGTYLTVDRFRSIEAWTGFLEQHGATYEQLDQRCRGLALSEVELAP